MSKVKGLQGNASFNFAYTSSHDANGSKSYEYSVEVVSSGFTVSVSRIWFDRSDFLCFFGEVEEMLDGKKDNAKLCSMSDFQLQIKQYDNAGHFVAVFILSSPMDQNEAKLTVKLETQSILDFISELRASVE